MWPDPGVGITSAGINAEGVNAASWKSESRRLPTRQYDDPGKLAGPGLHDSLSTVKQVGATSASTAHNRKETRQPTAPYTAWFDNRTLEESLLVFWGL